MTSTFSTLILAETLAPRWLVIAFAMIALIVIATHAFSLATTEMSPSRRRIRSANAFLLTLLVAGLAYAVGVATPDEPRQFALAWTFVLCMIAMVIAVASLDALNSLRLHAKERQAVRRELDRARLEVMTLTQAKK